MPKKFTDQYALPERIEYWNNLVDAVIDAIVDGTDESVLLDISFSYMVHGRKENHYPEPETPAVVQWLDSEEVAVHIKYVEDLSQLKEGLKAIVPGDNTHDLYVNFQTVEMFEKYACIVDSLFAIAFSLFFQDSLTVEMFDPNDKIPVVGKVFIGPPTSQIYTDLMETFSVASMLDAYTEGLIAGSQLRSPNLLLIAELGKNFVLNGLLDIKAAYMIDMHGEEEIRIADSWVNYGFDTYFTIGIVRLNVLMRMKLGIPTTVDMPPDVYVGLLNYIITTHKYCGIVLNAFEEFLSKQLNSPSSFDRAKLDENENMFQQELKNISQYLESK